MRNVILCFDVFVSQSQKLMVSVTPNYSFQDAFDKDDKDSFREMCDLEYNVSQLAKSFKALGCQVAVHRKEISHLDV